ncbi:MAG: ABC transporter permease [Christensenellales bacterium]|jgi:peptide/nickel transport system permease protein
MRKPSKTLHHRGSEVASHWQLMRWRFTKHKLGVASAFVVVLLYFIAIFCEFLAPYTPVSYSSKYMNAPPQKIGFIVRDEKGSHFQLHVKGYSSVMNKAAGRWEHSIDNEIIIPIKFFARGDTYKMWGIFESDIHLIGPEDVSQPFYLWGTDRMGRDLMSRVLTGTRLSMSIGLIGVFLSLFLGVFLGGFSGYYGGRFDTVMQRVIEVLRSIPAIPLWMALAAAVPKSWSIMQTYFAITIILSLIGWTGLARVVRGRFLALKTEDFVTVAKLNGCSESRIVFKHMVPSFLSHIIAQTTLSIPRMIISETSLSFLGLGLRAPAISWGVLLQEAQNIRTIANAPWLLIAPSVFVIAAVLSMNFLGDALRDSADPYNT